MNIKTPRKTPYAKILKHQARERGVKPMPLEPEVLLKRVKDGGHSGQYLASAFNSAYRNEPFNNSLRDLIKLDDEGFRLFHQILHMRHVPGWSDEALYQLEQSILMVVKERK